MVAAVSEGMLAEKFSLCWAHLNERQRRLVVAAEARALGPGGISLAARASGLSRPTVIKGLQELDEAPLAGDRVRRAGAGRKRTVERDPELLAALDALVDPDSRGDPESPLRWTCKSTRQLADALAGRGFQVSDDTVGRLLKRQRYTLQRTLKTQEGASTPTGTSRSVREQQATRT